MDMSNTTYIDETGNEINITHYKVEQRMIVLKYFRKEFKDGETYPRPLAEAR